MAPRTREEADQMLEQFAQRDAEISRADTSRERAYDMAERFVKWVWAFGVLIMAVTVWVGKVQNEGTQREKEVAALSARVSDSEKADAALDRLVTAIQNTVEGNRRERLTAYDVLVTNIADLKKTVTEDHEKTRYMDIMRQIGRSNKEDFQQNKGYPAPNANAP